jgi:hypothetical protein
MHHQLQIRQAVGKEDPLLTREFFFPFITTLLYGLPHALSPNNRSGRTVIKVESVQMPEVSWWIRKIREWLVFDMKGKRFATSDYRNYTFHCMEIVYKGK